MPSEDNEADLGTKYLERDEYQEVYRKDGNVICRGLGLRTVAWEGSGTKVIIGKDLIEGQSWTMGVALLVTAGVVLLSCPRAVFDPHLPTGSVHLTREPAISKEWECLGPRAMQDDDLDPRKRD